MVHKIKTVNAQITKLGLSKRGRSAGAQLSYTQTKFKPHPVLAGGAITKS